MSVTFKGQVSQYGGVPVGSPITQGDVYFLHPVSGKGADGWSGKSPDRALKTWSYAHTKMTANQADVLHVLSGGNASSACSDYQSAALTLSKDGIKIYGWSGGSLFSPRARIAQLSTTKDVEALVTWSADNGHMEGISVFQGVASSTATAPIGMTVSGDRNTFYRCHFAGIGDAASMDVAGARHLKVTGSENLFEDCVIGVDTVTTSTVSYGVELAGGATRNIFRNCIFPMYSGDNGSRFLGQAASGIDRFNIFEDCLFYNAVDSGATSITEGFDLGAGGSPAGGIILRGACMIVGATEWDAGDTGNLLIATPTGAASTQGIAVEPAD